MPCLTIACLRGRAALAVVCFLLVSADVTDAAAQSRRRATRQRDQSASSRQRQESDANRAQAADEPTADAASAPAAQTPIVAQQLAPGVCYKPGTLIDAGAVASAFIASQYQWPQPDGPGTRITITYSYSNLLNGQMSGITRAQLKQAVETALSVWASYAPLDFVEVEDSGPEPTRSETSYAAAGRPAIRFGHHPIDGASGPELAHAYFPYSDTDGLAGDVHFDRDEDWSGADGGYFLETALHEIGHTLGLDHVTRTDAIMYPLIAERFTGTTDAYLLDDDIAGIQWVYGAGVGSVTPLEDLEEPTDPEPPVDPPTGSVIASVDDTTGQLVIAGGVEDNRVLVASWWRMLLVIGRGETTINGQPWQLFAGHNGEVACELGTGADTLEGYLLRAELLDCDLGEGDDRLRLNWCNLSSLIADGGDGDDSYRASRAWVGVSELANFESVPTRSWWRHWLRWR